MTHDATEQFLRAFQSAIQSGQFLKCTLGKPRPGSAGDLKNVYFRTVLLKKGPHIAANFRYQTRDEVKNYSPEVAVSVLRELLGTVLLNADLFTTTSDYTLQTSSGGKMLLLQKKPSQTDTATLDHNREKRRLIQPTAPWLHALGITNSRGEVLANAQDKWRQINKYLEIIQSLLEETPLPKDPHIADMGSGKGYLTFALYDFLTNVLGLSPLVTGIELRANLVELCRKTAQESNFEGLHFITQNINDYQPERLDMLIALHACDTATDMALACGVRKQAKIIVAAPCCHKQIRKEMTAQNELAPVLRHGILAERQAEILTDGIRALLLEAEGYQTKVFEFISSEHTAKNVMITAILPEHDRKDARQLRRKKALDQIAALKSGFGIKEHCLEELLGAES
jgi:SAM-dependent methyltransferase